MDEYLLYNRDINNNNNLENINNDEESHFDLIVKKFQLYLF